MSTPENWTPEEQRLHDALHRSAERVQPGPDGLARIRRRTAVVPMWRRPVVLGLAGATALAAAVIVGGVIVLGDDDDGPPVATQTSTSPSESPSETTTSTPGPSTPPPAETTAPTTSLTVPVYYVAEGGDGLRLVREFHTVETSLPPIAAAVNEMLTAPPADPDYTTLWAPGVEVTTAEIGDGVIDVALTGAASLDAVTGDDPDLALQQLVYTATAAAADAELDGSLPVQVSVDGAPAGEPIARAEATQVRRLVQLNDPAEGAVVPGAVTVTGEAAVNEANVLWELRRDGEVVDSGNTTAETCCTFSPFAFELNLEPGAYEIVVSESDVSNGEGRPVATDSRTFTVE